MLKKRFIISAGIVFLALFSITLGCDTGSSGSSSSSSSSSGGCDGGSSGASSSSSSSSSNSSSSGGTIPEDNFAINGGVENGLTNWSTTGGGTLTRSTADRHSGSASALITGRSANWHGLTFNVGSLTNGNPYDVSVWVKLAPGSTDGEITLTAKRQDDSDTSTFNEYTHVAAAPAAANGWTQLRGLYTQNGTPFQHFIIESANTTVSYYVDDFSIVGEVDEPSDPLVQATNPVIWADVPDPSVIRVGNTYYMSSTTMHMNPGVPIMKSTDLVNWKIVSYAHQALGSTDALNLVNGQEAYGDGSWASSICFVNGTYYVSTFSYSTNKTYIFKTGDIENGPWTTSVLNAVYHDSTLFFENGRAFLVYGINDIRIIELTPDASAIKSGGLNQVLIRNSSAIAGSRFNVQSEGAHIQKINGWYYVSLICWPSGGMRTQLVYRSSTLTGTYEGRVALQNQGIAQGGFIDTPSGKWYAFLFKDNGSVGRIPYLVPVTWQNNWPVLGVNGTVPQNLGFTVEDKGLGGIVRSDEFSDASLDLAWQWNHNPDANGWSLVSRAGHLRLTNTRLDNSFVGTRNTLTQRTSGPASSAIVALETSGMKAGDYAGLGALQKNYGFVGVTQSGSSQSVVMVNAGSGSAQEIARVNINQNRIYLRVDMNFQNQADQATFFYSLDGSNWRSIGNTLQMSYTMPHFMGYRFALFNYATQTTGGYVDFDYFRVEE